MTSLDDMKKTARYAQKVADLISRPTYVKKQALFKALASDDHWETHAVLDALDDKKFAEWNELPQMPFFEHAAMFGRLDVIQRLAEKFRMTVAQQGPDPICRNQILLAFHTAVIHGHEAVADYCLKECGADPNQVWGSYEAPAMDTAIKEGSIRKVQYLIDAGACITRENLISAIVTKNMAMIDFLLDNGADINNAGINKDFIPLNTAINQNTFDIARHLLNRGANPLATPIAAAEAMRHSIHHGNAEMVMTLIARGVAPTEEYIQHADKKGQPEIAIILKKALPPTPPAKPKRKM